MVSAPPACGIGTEHPFIARKVPDSSHFRKVFGTTILEDQISSKVSAERTEVSGAAELGSCALEIAA